METQKASTDTIQDNNSSLFIVLYTEHRNLVKHILLVHQIKHIRWYSADFKDAIEWKVQYIELIYHEPQTLLFLLQI